ncbi:MAG: hypothetical protein U5K27_01935 [Desulfotignum sp.]|nr:hypothetical protein [Desulfotignum sp.]
MTSDLEELLRETTVNGEGCAFVADARRQNSGSPEDFLVGQKDSRILPMVMPFWRQRPGLLAFSMGTRPIMLLSIILHRWIYFLCGGGI